jgi:hypothetical protein
MFKARPENNEWCTLELVNENVPPRLIQKPKKSRQAKKGIKRQTKQRSIIRIAFSSSNLLRVIFCCSFHKRYAIYRQMSPLVSLANISIESTVHHSTVFTAASATDHEFRNSKMNTVLIDTREICKLMDELERDI